MGASDGETIRASCATPAVFASIFDRHFETVHAFARRRVGDDLADEIASETFARAFDQRRRYDVGVPDARPWLLGIYERARGHSEGTYRQMFTLVGDALRDPAATTPRQRGALYEVAARIPGVELVGSVRDRSGRDGIAVAMRNEPDGTRDTLIFDPESGALLGEEKVGLHGGFYPAGKVVSYATYSARIVD